MWALVSLSSGHTRNYCTHLYLQKVFQQRNRSKKTIFLDNHSSTNQKAYFYINRMKGFNQVSVFSFRSSDQRLTKGNDSFEYMHSLLYTTWAQIHILLNSEVHQPSTRWSSVALSSFTNCSLHCKWFGGREHSAHKTMWVNKTTSPWKLRFIPRWKGKTRSE